MADASLVGGSGERAPRRARRQAGETVMTLPRDRDDVASGQERDDVASGQERHQTLITLPQARH